MAVQKHEIPKSRRGNGRRSLFTVEDAAALQADPNEWYLIEGYSGSQVPAGLKELEGFQFKTARLDESTRGLFGRYVGVEKTVEEVAEAGDVPVEGFEEAPAF